MKRDAGAKAGAGAAAHIVRMVEQRAHERADALLYSFLDVQGREVERFTRGEFLARVRAISGHLASSGTLSPGDRVLLAYPAGLEMVCAFFACVDAGLIPVPTECPSPATWRASLRRLAHIARDCAPAAVLSSAAVIDRTGREPGAGDPEFKALGGLRWMATDLMRGDLPSPSHAGARVLFLQYTSGSTEAPRGVMVTHENIIANARATVDHADAVAVCWLPQHHDMGLIGYYINVAISGATLHCFSPSSFIQNPALWLRTISRHRATASSAPNFALEHCLRRAPPDSPSLGGLDLASLKFLMVASEPVNPDTYRRFQQAYGPHGLDPDALVVAYGLAENTLAVSSYGRRCLSVSRTELAEGRVRTSAQVSDVHAARHVLSCGRPLGDNRVLIVDADSGRIRPEGSVGEIWVAGSSRCEGYWNKPRTTERTFRARPCGAPQVLGVDFLRTGDMGFLFDGELYVCGRLKDMMIVRGRNIYPQDIEALAQSACEALRPGGVVAFQMAEAGEDRLVVMAELRHAGATPDGAAVAAAIRRDMGLWPSRIVFVPPKSLPKTSSGKSRRSSARRMLAQADIPIWSEFRPPTLAPDSSGLPAAAEREDFGYFRERYGLSGEEHCTLPDAGVDSLDLVVFLHELVVKMKAAGAGDLAEQLDPRTVQEAPVAELFGLARQAGQDPALAVAQLRSMLGRQRDSSSGSERALMMADRRLSPGFSIQAAQESQAGARHVLLTGGTGFLGPFLLASLLAQTTARIEVLVRAGSVPEARARLIAGLKGVGTRSAAFWREFEERVLTLPGDLSAPRLGLSAQGWSRLCAEVDTIYHNGAAVNYIKTYERLRAPNVLGTLEVLKLATQTRPKVFNHVSTTFIFGWAAVDVLREDEANARMQWLDFGYSQSKWVAEQLVLQARAGGLPTRIFRPALVTPSLEGGGFDSDIALRLFAFMIKHGVGVSAENQVSILPVDVVADNLVAISNLADTTGQVFHITRDTHCGMGEVLAAISRATGRRFTSFGLKAFVPEVIRRCTRRDPLYPLLDFLVGSIDGISAMEFKRYDNSNYRRARARAPFARADPSLEETVAGILRFLSAHGLADIARLPNDLSASSSLAGFAGAGVR